MVGRYLTLLNLPEKAVIFATSAPPSKLSWLTASNHASTGIDAAIIDDVDFANDRTPARKQPATPPPLVRVEAPPAGNAASDTSVWKRLATWTVFVDHTLDEGCFLFGQFDNNTSFRVGVNRESGGHYYVMFTNPAWKSLEIGQKYAVQFQFDSHPL